ncbi:helix-turn-helix domain-containing protein [Parablautia sp. Marseille-Q6255]|uniref:helix-turn-helix domain-containing protein n=1 Tax=Parablautia sp. Marseille-Q6255 TaxID=3039593 RepID=UPI0024BC4FF7|nr:helix-turn-helix domain-containing protein [Parablautia sp. Marseille-Q6255]
MPVKTVTAETIATMAAKEAVKELRKELEKEKRVKTFRNTKKLLQNYNRICESVQEGISDLTEMDNSDELEEFTEEDIFINSILKSKLRSIVMIAHIDKCVALLEREQYSKNTPEKFLAFKYFYFDEMTYESITEVYGYSERTARRWVQELTNILSVYLFGADAVNLE